jgi:hypothetical protein
MKSLVRFAALAAMLALAAGCALIDSATGQSEALRLRQIGTPAEAEILRIWDTGITVNDDPVIGMEVEVRPAEGEPFRAVIPRTWISRLDVPSFQPGEVVAVRYDPNDPTRAALDDPPFPSWEEPAAPGSGYETSVSFGLRLCARSPDGERDDVETVFLVIGPDGRRYETRRNGKADDERICVWYPDDFDDAGSAPGRYRYEIRVGGEIADRGELTLRD